MTLIKEKYKNLIIKFGGNIARPRFGWKKKITKLIKLVYLPLELPFELLGDIIFLPKRFCTINIKNPKKILIVKTDQFGDVLFSTMFLPIIKKNHPDALIDYLINPKTEILLKKNPHINKLHFWNDPFLYFLLGRNEKRMPFFTVLKNCIACIKNIRTERYDIIINTRAYPPSNNIFLKLMWPHTLIAFEMSEQSYCADIWAHYDMRDEEWKNFLNLLSPFCKNVEQEAFSEEFYNFDDSILSALPSGFGETIAMISPISFDRERYWPIDSWRAVIEHLLSKNYSVIITGLPSQEKLIEKIISDLPQDKIYIATKHSISEIASLLRKSKVWIGIDSFTAHLAIALKKETLCLVNEKYYFVKGWSKKFWVDARSMIPLIKEVRLLSTNSEAEKATEIIDSSIR